MKGNYLNKLLSINAKHALYREDGKWFHNLKNFPGVLFDKNGYIIFGRDTDYFQNPHLQIKNDLHIKNGIESLINYQQFTVSESELIFGIPLADSGKEDNQEGTVRVMRKIEMILRKKKLVSEVKRLYDNTCQLCGSQILISEKQYYSEVHHIISLGAPHNGNDTIENMLCVCPNCHIQLDFKSIPLQTSKLLINRHSISPKSIAYHNSLYISKIKL